LTRNHRQSLGFRILAAVLFAAACGGGGGPADTTDSRSLELHGTELVVGSTIDEWGVLVLDPSGSQAVLRPLRAPGEISWEGGTDLPAFEEVHAIGGSSVVMRSGRGTVSRYDPASDAVETLDHRLDGEVHWEGTDRGGAFINGASGAIVVVLPDRSWRYEVGGQVDWAGVVHEGIAVLRPGPEFWYVQHGADAPTVEASVDVGGPGLVTAWGRRLVFVNAEDGRSIEVLTADTGETVGRVELAGDLSALAASPSSHELYAGIEDPSGIVAVNRFSFTQRLLASLDRPPVEIRPSLFGEYLLVHDGEQTWRLDSENGELSPIPGDWGPDLPLGLPNGVVLVRTEGGVSQVNAAGQIEGDPIADQGESTWLAVHWTPVARGLSDEIEGLPLAVSPGRPAAVPSPPDSAPDDAEIVPVIPPDVAPGYYAIVGSARQRAGIEVLVAELAEAGFPVEVQSIVDVAGENWHRGLVGPYATRAEAEAAARQLQRERQLQSWVTGINADS